MNAFFYRTPLVAASGRGLWRNYNISHKLLRQTQFLEKWKFWKFWNGLLCRNKSGSRPLLNVVVYWKSSNTEACAKKLSQILANNIDNGVRGIGLRIYVRYCSLVKILQSCYFNIFGINHRCFRKMPTKKNNE